MEISDENNIAIYTCIMLTYYQTIPSTYVHISGIINLLSIKEGLNLAEHVSTLHKFEF